MDQLRDFSDDRLVVGCIYCGGQKETRDHVPSRVLLDRPFPENLPVVAACERCNTGFSTDEEYVACLLESARQGTTNPDLIERSVVADILRRKPELRKKLENARSVQNGHTQFEVDGPRIEKVMLKLARGHAAFELSQIRLEEPTRVWWRPIGLLPAEVREEFDACYVTEVFGEVGSRGMQRMVAASVRLKASDGKKETTKSVLVNDWVVIQEGRYRYLAIDESPYVVVRFVISEYLACEIVWSSDESHLL